MPGKYLITTLGCKVNQYESEHLREILESHGLIAAIGGEKPDIAIVNTCAVTSSASRKSRQSLRKLTRNGSTTVVAVGCGATHDAERLSALPGVSAVFGHETDIAAEVSLLISRKFGPQVSGSSLTGVSTVKQTARHKAGLTQTGSRGEATTAIGNDVWIMPQVAGVEPGQPAKTAATAISILGHKLPIVNNDRALSSRIDVFRGHQRAFLKVQDGCDAFCSYCVIPRLRPLVRSKPIEVAVREARSLVGNGHKEIIVTGIFLGAYGRETAIRKRFGSQRSPLADLVDALAQVEGLERLRLSSLEPGDVDDWLLDVLADRSVCVPHLHLPLQAGSQAILSKMNRQYTRDDFDGMIRRTRDRLDRPAISTDIIVGFPGETDADFRATLDAARSAEFVKIHAFPFSPRERTAAARWQKDFVHNGLVKARMGELAVLERELSLAYRRSFLGKTQRVLVEAGAAVEDSDLPRVAHGRTDRYFEVHFESNTVSPGEMALVRIDRITPTRTHGTMLPRGAGRLPLHVLT